MLQARAALVVAHPSHELLVHGWLQLNRPQVFVLTDGSGRSGSSRLSQTTRLLEQVGAQRGSIYGRLTDLEAYAINLKHNVSYFILLLLLPALRSELIHTFSCAYPRVAALESSSNP